MIITISEFYAYLSQKSIDHGPDRNYTNQGTNLDPGTCLVLDNTDEFTLNNIDPGTYLVQNST